MRRIGAARPGAAGRQPAGPERVRGCRRLKAEPATARIPVLHITASYMTPADMARGLESGAENYLVEPVEPEVLIATINSVLRARRAAESARAMAREWQATFDAISDGVAVVDAEGRIRRANECLARILGRPVSELIGADRYRRLWASVAGQGQPFARAIESRRRETWNSNIEGKRLHLMVDPMFDEIGCGDRSGPHRQRRHREAPAGRPVPGEPEVRDDRHAGGGRGARFQQSADQHHGERQPDCERSAGGFAARAKSWRTFCVRASAPRT